MSASPYATDLQLALQRDEFFLEFQPQFDSHTGELCGAEALLRWQHPLLGKTPPTAFIPQAENSGLIRALGMWTLQQTLQAWQQMYHQTGRQMRMAVNVAFVEIADSDYASRVLTLLQHHQVPGHALELELTETALLRKPTVSQANLQQLHDSGIHIALDDFGTGYSSLSHLSDLPITGIKLDRSFVAPMADNESQAHIVRSMLELAKRMKLETTAEGVEDEHCLRLVQALGCDRIQGFLYSAPLQLDTLIRYAQEGFPTSRDFYQHSLF